MSTQPSPGQVAAEKIVDSEHYTFPEPAKRRIAQIIDSVIDSASLPAAGNHKPDEDGVCEACGMDLIHCEPVKISTQPVQGLEQIAREAVGKINNKFQLSDNYNENNKAFKFVHGCILRACQAAASQAAIK